VPRSMARSLERSPESRGKDIGLPQYLIVNSRKSGRNKISVSA